MLRRESGSGLLVLGSMFALGQLVLLLIVVLKLVDAIPRVDPIRIASVSDRSVIDRRVRTVQSPPVKVDADETTDHVP